MLPYRLLCISAAAPLRVAQQRGGAWALSINVNGPPLGNFFSKDNKKLSGSSFGLGLGLGTRPCYNPTPLVNVSAHFHLLSLVALAICYTSVKSELGGQPTRSIHSLSKRLKFSVGPAGPFERAGEGMANYMGQDSSRSSTPRL